MSRQSLIRLHISYLILKSSQGRHDLHHTEHTLATMRSKAQLVSSGKEDTIVAIINEHAQTARSSLGQTGGKNWAGMIQSLECYKDKQMTWGTFDVRS